IIITDTCVIIRLSRYNKKYTPSKEIVHADKHSVNGFVIYFLERILIVGTANVLSATILVFFFQAEAGIRDPLVTGVQTCALPILRARLAAIGEQSVTRALVDRRRAERKGDEPFFLVREYALTAAEALPDGNAVIAGRWWTPDEARARPRVSLEEDMAKSLQVTVGGRVAFDVQGVRVDAEVMSVRHVDWQSFTTNFFAILSPGALDGAPTTWVATARVPPAPEPRLQDAAVAVLPT